MGKLEKPSKLDIASECYADYEYAHCTDAFMETLPNLDVHQKLKEAFIAGSNWQAELHRKEDTATTCRAIERAIIKHNHSTQETVLKNFRNICGSLNKGKCVIDGKRCTFNNCEALKDLFKE